MKRGEFRSWLGGKYQEYLYEHDAFNEPVKPLSYYYNEYKWWLKRQYRSYQKQEQKKREYNAKFNAG